jgi:FMN-dependent NADH-azoreductase
MAWIVLFAAGMVEILMALALKFADGWTHPWPSALGIGAALLSIFLLTHALRDLPVGTAYAIWTGIGAVGITVLGMVLFGESAAPLRLVCIGLIVARTMSRLLYVQASPANAASTSGAVAHAFLDAYREGHPDDTIDIVDVWDLDLPPFDADMISAKFAVLRRQQATPAQQALWQRAIAHAQRFNAADAYLFSVPMWNFGIPYRLKHYIDVVTLAGQNWTWSRETGYVALLPGKKAALVYSSAGDYPLGPAFDASDFQKPYMRRWLRFIGIEDVHEVRAAPTLTTPEHLAQVKDRARDDARALAANW